jgi:hypothetical protein
MSNVDKQTKRIFCRYSLLTSIPDPAFTQTLGMSASAHTSVAAMPERKTSVHTISLIARATSLAPFCAATLSFPSLRTKQSEKSSASIKAHVICFEEIQTSSENRSSEPALLCRLHVFLSILFRLFSLCQAGGSGLNLWSPCLSWHRF